MFQKIIKIMVLITLLSTYLYADDREFHVVTGLKTWHYVDDVWNENNRFMGVRYQLDDRLIFVDYSRFVNSHWQESWTLGISRDYHVYSRNQWGVYLGAGIGVVEGYTRGEVFTLFFSDTHSLYLSPHVRLMYADTVGFQHRMLGIAGTLEAVLVFRL